MAERLTTADLERIKRADLCTGCGFCTVSLERGRDHPPVEIRYEASLDSFAPTVVAAPNSDSTREVLCPGAQMDLPALSIAKYGKLPDDYRLGHVVGVRACHAADESVRTAAASGGAIPALLAQLFSEGAIDTAYVVDNGDHVRDAHGRLLTEAASLGQCHGSVYHPADFGRQLRNLVDSSARFAFVGLPCEIAALEQLKLRRPDVAARHVVSIGLFCGGINRFQGIAYYLQAYGVRWSAVKSIRYRVGTWPGRIEVSDDAGHRRQIPRIQGNSRWRILRYVVAFQGYWMLPRCRMCPDQISDFADIAVGDPHLPRFRKGSQGGHSAMITRTAAGEALVQRAVTSGRLAQSALSPDELIASQGYTLDNRRHALAYLRVARRLGFQLPELGMYPEALRTVKLRHYVYASVDMTKIALRRASGLRWLYLPLQAFEYLFITFTPMLLARRLVKLLRNR